ncbi:MAG: metallophosphoesterase, partial [Clostridia bacterium]|nr:metallophosphoesterase [Clostridia bacterium]
MRANRILARAGSVRRILRAMLAALLALGMCPPARATRVMVVSDLHYMAPALYADSDLFIRVLRPGDGKLTQHGDQLMDALRDTVIQQRPDALLVTGDLAFNGERESHEALAKRFADIEENGVPVWVIPGNHDINVSTARRFDGDGWSYTQTVSPEAFRAIYRDFMIPAAEGTGANLSYVARVDDRLWVAMTDAAFYRGEAQAFGVFTAEHAAWLEQAMREAGEAGEAGDVELITASHHSLLPHTEFSRDSYVMLGNAAMLALDQQYGVRLHLSGHLHVQHMTRQGGVTDAALGAFCTWPHRYALVTLRDDGSLEYEARSLDEALLPEGFMAMSRAWFADIARAKAKASLPEETAEAEVEAMADFAARFNLSYFAGTYRSDDPSWRADPAYALWQQQADSLFGQ